MVNQQQYISCPDCGMQIPFDPYELLKGTKFACPRCPALSIGLAQESHNLVATSLEKFEGLKKQFKKNM